jgi:DnaJ-class molecular chaperone
MHEEWVEEEDFEKPHEHHHSHGPFRTECKFCKGTGVHPNTMTSLKHQQCPVCKGQGILMFNGDRDDAKPCIKCASSGREPGSDPLKPCSVCSGYGIK